MDINADGFADILSGCYSRKVGDTDAGLFWVLYGDKDRKFAKPVELLGTDGRPLMIPWDASWEGYDEDEDDREGQLTRPFAGDVNGDGKLDLVAGNLAGKFYFFAGEGKGDFQPKSVLLTDASGEPLRRNLLNSDPFLVDWDGDGDLDLLSGGSEGAIAWAENKAARGEAGGTPKYSAMTTLIPAPPKDKEGNSGDAPGKDVRIWVADLNGDGKLDILAGDHQHHGGEPRQDLSDEDMKELEALQHELNKAGENWTAAYDALCSKYQKEFEEAVKKAGKELSEAEQAKLWQDLVGDKLDKDEELSALRKRGEELQGEMQKYLTPRVNTGYVWLYAQK